MREQYISQNGKLIVDLAGWEEVWKNVNNVDIVKLRVISSSEAT